MAAGKNENHLHGRKYCKHTTVTDSARKIAKLADSFPEVTKISLGVIEGKGSAQLGMKFTAIHGGWTIKVGGSHATQKLHIYTNDPAGTRNKIEEHFPGVSN